jgi:hypothetical protein
MSSSRAMNAMKSAICLTANTSNKNINKRQRLYSAKPMSALSVLKNTNLRDSHTVKPIMLIEEDPKKHAYSISGNLHNN